MNVLTTSEVPLQTQKCNAATMHRLLPKAAVKLTGHTIPPELVDIIWTYTSAGTLTRKEAEAHRQTLMNDRRVNPSDWVSISIAVFLVGGSFVANSVRVTRSLSVSTDGIH